MDSSEAKIIWKQLSYFILLIWGLIRMDIMLFVVDAFVWFYHIDKIRSQISEEGDNIFHTLVKDSCAFFLLNILLKINSYYCL